MATKGYQPKMVYGKPNPNYEGPQKAQDNNLASDKDFEDNIIQVDGFSSSYSDDEDLAEDRIDDHLEDSGAWRDGYREFLNQEMEDYREGYKDILIDEMADEYMYQSSAVEPDENSTDEEIQEFQELKKEALEVAQINFEESVKEMGYIDLPEEEESRRKFIKKFLKDNKSEGRMPTSDDVAEFMHSQLR